MSEQTKIEQGIREEFLAAAKAGVDSLFAANPELDGMIAMGLTITPEGVLSNSSVNLSFALGYSPEMIYAMAQTLVMEAARIAESLIETFSHEGAVH